ATVDRRRIDERLERGTDLPLCLRGAVEFAPREIEPADHGANLTGSVVNREECALHYRILLECNGLRSATLYRAHLYLHDVTHIQKIGGGDLPRPRKRAFGKVDLVRAYAEPGAAIA